MEYKYTCKLSGHRLAKDAEYSIDVTLDIPDDVTRAQLINVCLGTSTRVKIASIMGNNPSKCPEWEIFGYKTSWNEVYSKATKSETKPIDNVMKLGLADFVNFICEAYPAIYALDNVDDVLILYARKHNADIDDVRKEWKSK